MDRLSERLRSADNALTTLRELTVIAKPSMIERDAAIQRFEYTTEACWKAAQAVLSVRFGVEAASPKTVIRACAQNGLLDESDARIAMSAVDDRNLTSHTYNEGLADRLFSRLDKYALVFSRWLMRLQQPE